MGKTIIYIGAVLVILGVILTYAPGQLRWFGRLPGDIHIKSNNGSVFIPVTSMIILSVLLTVIINLFLRK